MARRQLKLAFAAYNHPVQNATAWRLPDAVVGAAADPAFILSTVRRAEAGLFDYYFVPSILSSAKPADLAAGNDPFRLDPFPLASFVAASTERIGLAVTVNTTYTHPLDVARASASLDHLSRGRAALNLVAGADGSGAARSYGRGPHPPPEAKYARAEEYVQLLLALWDSWDRDWLVADRASGVLVDPAAMHAIDFAGEHFTVAGALSVPPPPQGRIPLIHAGLSPQSQAFGARHADIRFVPFDGVASARTRYRQIKEQVAGLGRDPDRHFVIAGLTVFTAETDAQARAIFRRTLDMCSAEALPEPVLARLGLDPRTARPQDRLDHLLPEDVLLDESVLAGRAVAAIGDPGITLRDLAHFVATEALGQSYLVGGAARVAGWLEEQLDGRTFDGVILYPPYLPSPLDAFVRHVVPQLQRRGIFRTSYETATFSEHFGLHVPSAIS